VSDLSVSGPLNSGHLYTVTASVTDADGLGDLAGGLLKDVSSGATITTFEGALGTYHATVSWTLIQPHHDISFTGSSGAVEVEAVFMDHASHEGRRRLTLTLQCGTDYSMACSGTCILPYDGNHCGTCGNNCSTRLQAGESEMQCVSGTCSITLDTYTTNRSTCSTLCAARGQQCTAGTSSYNGFGDLIYGWAVYGDLCSYALTSCSAVPDATRDCGAYYGADNLNRVTCFCN
jgi:hypothetical protein